MNVETLRFLVLDNFRRHAASFGLNADSLRVDYVLNWGGFVNYSFSVDDGQTAFHLKLSASEEGQDALRRWMSLAPLLEKYRPPRILDWIDVGPAAGLLFPQLQGSAPAFSDEVLLSLLPVLRSLNADRELSNALHDATSATGRDSYFESFHERFEADLAAIGGERPPFVSTDDLRYMQDEAAALAHLVNRQVPFQEHLTTPIHGDLWLNNVLWVAPQHWSLIDWDDLRLGDPAADFATLIGPTAHDLRPLKRRELVDGALTAAERERLTILGRATLLDWVIDPLADWLEANVAPDVMHAVRTEKERVHREALKLYRELYR